MAIKQKRKYCRECRRKTLHQKEEFSFAVGCLLTIVTGGLFALVWGIVILSDMVKPYRCQSCGS